MSLSFTPAVERALESAGAEAIANIIQYVSTEHLLLGLLPAEHSSKSNLAMRVLEKRLSITPRKLRLLLKEAMGRPGDRYDPAKPLQLTGNGKEALQFAIEEAEQSNNPSMDTGYLLIGLMRQERGLASRMLTQLGVTVERCRESVQLERGEDGEDGRVA